MPPRGTPSGPLPGRPDPGYHLRPRRGPDPVPCGGTRPTLYGGMHPEESSRGQLLPEPRVVPDPSTSLRPAAPDWKFCPACGAALSGEGRFCTSCGAPLIPAASETAPSPGGRDASRLGWLVAGLLFGALVLAIAFPAINRAAGGGPSPAPPRPAGGVGPDLSTMTPREAAARLFDRVMTAVERGDTLEVFTFLPMAIAAHQRAMPLDADAAFDLSVLQAVSFDYVAALVTAESALAENPDHLLLLSAAAGAAAAMGDTALAARYHRRTLEVYDAQVALGLPEYRSRPALLPMLRGEAEAFVRNLPPE